MKTLGIIRDLSINQLNIPFNVAFKHASAARTLTLSLWVEARSASNHTGYGESCPRPYVTGESLETALAFFTHNKEAVMNEVVDVSSLNAWAARNRLAIDQNPAAWCALELALLDLFAKENSQSIEALLALPKINGAFQYSAVIGDSSFETYRTQFDCYLQMGF